MWTKCSPLLFTQRQGGCGSVCVSNQHLLSSPGSAHGPRGCGAGIAGGTEPFHPGCQGSLQLPLGTRTEEFLSAGALSSGAAVQQEPSPGSTGPGGTRGAAGTERAPGHEPGLTCHVLCPADKPQVRVSQNYPLQGLTREGEPLELTCTAFGKPQ